MPTCYIVFAMKIIDIYYKTTVQRGLEKNSKNSVFSVHNKITSAD